MKNYVHIDEQLISAILAETGIQSKKEAGEQPLKLLLSLMRQKRIREFRGKLKWS